MATRMRAVVTTIKLRVKQNSSFSGKGSQAWALDNFAVLGTGPQYIDDDFDPATSCYWLAQTGTVKVGLHFCVHNLSIVTVFLLTVSSRCSHPVMR